MKLAPLLVALISAPSLAHMGGVWGFSGQFGASCNTGGCHGGGQVPTVSLTGPTALDAGETGDYVFTISGGAAVVGGLDVSVDSNSAQLVPGPGSWLFNFEVTHNGPQPFDAGTLVFTFSLIAPPAGGTIHLYGAGNSCNGDGATSGDRAAATQLAIQVTGAPVPPDAGPTTRLPAVANNETPVLGTEPGGCEAGGASRVAPLVCLCAFAVARRRSLQR